MLRWKIEALYSSVNYKGQHTLRLEKKVYYVAIRYYVVFSLDPKLPRFTQLSHTSTRQ